MSFEEQESVELTVEALQDVTAPADTRDKRAWEEIERVHAVIVASQPDYYAEHPVEWRPEYEGHTGLWGKCQRLMTYHDRATIALGKVFLFPDMKKATEHTPTKPLPTRDNVKFFLARFDVGIVFDDFYRDYLMSGYPGHERLDDNVLRGIWNTLHRLGLEIKKERLTDFLLDIGRENTSHMMRELFDELELLWDGKERLDAWLIDYCHAEDTPLNRFISASTLIATVRRVRRPGFPYKFVPRLEGAQTIGKSPILKVLGLGKHYSDSMPRAASPKQVLEETRGKLIIEFGELADRSQKSLEEWKASTSRTHDCACLKYDKFETEYPRQWIGWETTNEFETNTDKTGNDRVLSVLCNGDINSKRMLLIDELRDDILQIYAEAAIRERKATNADIYPTGDTAKAAGIEQDKRFKKTEYFEDLEMRLEGIESGFLPYNETLKICGIDPLHYRHDPRVANPISTAMQKLCWKKARKTINRTVSVDAKGTKVVKAQKGQGLH